MTNAQPTVCYYAEAGAPRGPVSAAELRAMAAEGRIQPDTLVWTPGLSQWVRYGELAWPEATPPSVEPIRRCAECGRDFPEGDTIRLGPLWVCGSCKPLVVQRWMERGLGTGAIPYAGFWSRLAASILDGIVLMIAYYAIYVPVIWTLVRRLRPSERPIENLVVFSSVTVTLWALSIAMHALYEIWMVGRFGATLGKMALQLRVVRADGSRVGYARAAGRHFAKYLSQLTAGIGFLLAAWDPEKRALHDMVADTRVVRS